VGLYETHGVPTSAMNGGEWLLQLEAGTVLQMHAVPPPPRLGMGVTFDYHSDSLVVVSVEEAGPAYSAGLRQGDRIVALSGRRVSAMSEGDARQAMDHGAIGDVNMTVQHANGATEDLTVHRDAVYPAH
jgi:predicted metalloprotease with PDZ domain